MDTMAHFLSEWPGIARERIGWGMAEVVHAMEPNDLRL